MAKPKIKIAEQGDKVMEEVCPKCNDNLVIQMDNGGTEFFECKNCRFRIIKKEANKILEMTPKIKKLIEDSTLILASVTPENRPHTIAVAYVKVKDNKLIITDNYMKTTPMNIKLNPNISLLLIDKEEGYRIEGLADYWKEGEYFEFIKSVKENKNEPCKGAIVVTISKIQKLE